MEKSLNKFFTYYLRIISNQLQILSRTETYFFMFSIHHFFKPEVYEKI